MFEENLIGQKHMRKLPLYTAIAIVKNVPRNVTKFISALGLKLDIINANDTRIYLTYFYIILTPVFMIFMIIWITRSY